MISELLLRTGLAARRRITRAGSSPHLPCSGLLAFLLLAQTGLGQINPNSPTSQWVPILYGNNNYPDPSGDQQTGSAESDIVGNAAEPSLFMQFLNGYIGFRIRVGADVSPAGFKGAAFIGLDANLDGKLDLFIGVNNQGSGNQVGLWNPGTGLNISPSTTTIASPATFSFSETSTNYGFAPVSVSTDPSATNYDLNADGKTDQFLSFFVSFSNVLSALAAQGITGFTSNSPMMIVAATATQDNSLNEDLNGVAGGINSSQTWGQLGASSEPYAPNGTAPAPEPSVTSLLLLGGLTLRYAFRRRS